MKIEKQTMYVLVSIVCIFWILFNVVFPFISGALTVTGNRRGWRGYSSEYKPDIDTYIGEYKTVNGLYRGYSEPTSVGNPEYYIYIENESYSCWWTKDKFISSLDHCIGKEITLYLELYSDRCGMDIWVITGFKTL